VSGMSRTVQYLVTSGPAARTKVHWVVYPRSNRAAAALQTLLCVRPGATTRLKLTACIDQHQQRVPVFLGRSFHCSVGISY
jgi:hypothetical protein